MGTRHLSSHPWLPGCLLSLDVSTLLAKLFLPRDQENKVSSGHGSTALAVVLPGGCGAGTLLVTSQGRGLWARGMFCPHGSPTSFSPSVKGRGPGTESRGPGLSSNLLKGLGVPHSGPGFHGYQRSWKTPETFRKKEGRAQ